MDLQKGDSYVSCIKVRGVPIIPPLMTEDVRNEMRYYKHLAIAVEERMKRLESLLRAEIYASDETLERNSVARAEESSDPATLTNCMEIHSRNVECPKDEGSVNERDSPERVSPSNEKSVPDETTSMDVTMAMSDDTNSHQDDSFKTDRTSLTLENTAERKKPEVPKTLDIVPITIDNTISDEKTLLHRESEDSSDNSAMSLGSERPPGSTTTSPNSEETAPKLVRQGSYVLDSPSPMLLAHMREEKTTLDYAPTPTNKGSSSKRKEWNISEAKSEWQLQGRKDTALVVTDTAASMIGRNDGVRRNSTSNASQARSVARRCAQGRTGTSQFGGTRRIARSADCIRSMLRRDAESSKVVVTNGRVKKSSFSSSSSASSPSPPLPPTTRSECTEKRRGCSIPSSVKKLGGSLDSLSYSNVRRCPERVAPRVQTRSVNVASKNSDVATTTAPTNQNFASASTQKVLSAVTSKRLADIFKQIQSTHERQMNELIARQQREQRNMIEEFEKQRMLLLSQIERTFPGVRLHEIAEKIPTLPASSVLQRNGAPETPNDATEKIIASPKISNGLSNHDDDRTIRCPLDDIYPREDSNKQPPSPPIGFISGSQRTNYGVSRRLFPLESNTSHIPVVGHIPYGERHVKAANVINAYARGYLVRRIMKTERVMALKSTYSEALQCMLKLHVDAPLALPELNFHQRLQLQCEAASMNIVELFAQETAKRMEIIEQDRQVKRARQERPNSARSYYSFATQRTLARKKLKEMGDFQTVVGSRSTGSRNRCQTWTSYAREKYTPSVMNQGIKRSTSAGAVRKPWR